MTVEMQLQTPGHSPTTSQSEGRRDRSTIPLVFGPRVLSYSSSPFSGRSMAQEGHRAPLGRLAPELMGAMLPTVPIAYAELLVAAGLMLTAVQEELVVSVSMPRPAFASAVTVGMLEKVGSPLQGTEVLEVLEAPAAIRHSVGRRGVPEAWRESEPVVPVVLVAREGTALRSARIPSSMARKAATEGLQEPVVTESAVKAVPGVQAASVFLVVQAETRGAATSETRV